MTATSRNIHQGSPWRAMTSEAGPNADVRAAQAGDQDAFARLVDSHYDLMFSCAMKLTGHRDQAEDITQQAAIKLALGIGQFRFESAFSTWLYRLVINCTHDYQRALNRDQGEPLETAQAAMAPDDMESLLLLRSALAAISDMGAGFAETAALVLGQGLSHQEAATVLGVVESTISWRLHEIRKRMRQLFASEATS